MSRSRPKSTIMAMALIASLAFLAPFSMAQTHPLPRPPQPRPSPNAPNPNFPPGLQGPMAQAPGPEPVDQQNQVALQSDIEKLYALTFVLREQMKATNTASTMSVSIVKQAQQIEKLAKEIKERAKR